MAQASIIHLQLLLLIPMSLPDDIIALLTLLLLGGVGAFVFAYVFTFAVRAFCQKVGWLDYPSERRVHTRPVPRLGGVGIFLAFFLASLLFYTPGPNFNPHANELTI